MDLLLSTNDRGMVKHFFVFTYATVLDYVCSGRSVRLGNLILLSNNNNNNNWH